MYPSSSSSAVDQPCLNPQSTCCQELGGAAQVFRRSPQLVGRLAHPAAITGVSVSARRGQSWRMWCTVCSASLQSQSAESMMRTYPCLSRSVPEVY